jgi:hypothetical protein
MHNMTVTEALYSFLHCNQILSFWLAPVLCFSPVDLTDVLVLKSGYDTVE